jgi:uroporphyrinogen decarboxylase
MMDLVDFSVRLFDDPRLVKRLLGAATQRAIDLALTLIQEGVDAIVMDADYCHQSGPIISPRHFEEFVLPLLKLQIEAIHGAGAYAIKHTDGRTWPILGMLLEAGIDGLHGIQPSAGMDLEQLRETCGRGFVLFGAVEGGELMSRTPIEIRDLVCRQMKAGGPEGGLVLTSSNSVQFGVPPGNYLAMVDAVRSCGEYPLR